MRVGSVVVDRCLHCHGAFYEKADAATLDADAVMQKLVGAKVAKPLSVSRRACPMGHGAMEAFRCQSLLHGDDATTVDVEHCRTCHGMWLDDGEARTLLRLAAQVGDVKDGVGWYLFQLFSGLPLEVLHPPHRRPVVVWSLMLTCVVAFGWQLVDVAGVEDVSRTASAALALRPDHVWAAPWTFLTYAFLHGGLAHLAGNLVFLWIFGDNVEDRTTRWRFLLGYLGCGAAGGLAHVLLVGGDTPLVGASGAIAGLLGAYLVLYPRVRLFVVIVFLRFRIPAVLYLGFWLLTNLLMALGSTVTEVAWWCHVGGFAAGVLWGALLRRRGDDDAARVPGLLAFQR